MGTNSNLMGPVGRFESSLRWGEPNHQRTQRFGFSRARHRVDLLRGDAKQSEYGKFIEAITIGRRLDDAAAPSRTAAVVVEAMGERDVATEVPLVRAAEHPKVVAEPRPVASDGVAVHLKLALAVFIARLRPRVHEAEDLSAKNRTARPSRPFDMLNGDNVTNRHMFAFHAVRNAMRSRVRWGGRGRGSWTLHTCMSRARVTGCPIHFTNAGHALSRRRCAAPLSMSLQHAASEPELHSALPPGVIRRNTLPIDRVEPRLQVGLSTGKITPWSEVDSWTRIIGRKTRNPRLLRWRARSPQHGASPNTGNRTCPTPPAVRRACYRSTKGGTSAPGAACIGGELRRFQRMRTFWRDRDALATER